MASVVPEGLKVSGNVGYTDAYYPGAAYGVPVAGVTPLLNQAGDPLLSATAIRPLTVGLTGLYRF